MDDALARFLVTQAPGLPDAGAVVEQVGLRLAAEGMPIDRLWLGLQAAHPLVAGTSLTWTPDQPLVRQDLPYQRRSVLAQRPGPLKQAIAQGHARFSPLGQPRGADGMNEVFWDGGYTDAVVVALPYEPVPSFFGTLATRQAGGFSDAQAQRITSIMPLLAVVVAAFTQRAFAQVLAQTYLGRDVGQRVAAGQIHRGEGENLHAAIWFSDLRGFSSMSQSLPPQTLLDLLNHAFELQVEAVEEAGGDVLKFMGDGMLAVFHGGTGADAERSACTAALAAARALPTRVARANVQRAADGVPTIQYGVALHFGDVMYGNIGAPHRLDFTVIGTAVNQAARLEGLCSQLGVHTVASSAFAQRCGEPLRPAGSFELKGVGQMEAFVVEDARSKT